MLVFGRCAKLGVARLLMLEVLVLPAELQAFSYVPTVKFRSLFRVVISKASFLKRLV
jgi:hypothetical protein